jgi:nicotinamide mononucleotide adenylyltransferase
MVKLSQYVEMMDKKVPVTRKFAVFTTGRFNPPTQGHAKLIETLNEKARQLGADAFVFTTQTVDKKGKNPLDWQTKNSFIRRLIPSANLVEQENIRHAWDAIEWLKIQGYTDVALVVGSDRIDEFEVRWQPYARKVFESAVIISGGFRDPDDEKTAAGMSATKAREAALQNDLGAFRAATGWSGDISIELFNAVRAGMVGD